MFHHLTLKSSNVKTGQIPVSTSDRKTCPESCKIKEACYASTGPLCILWIRVSNGKNNAMDWQTFTQKVTAIPNGQLWRHNQAGDLVGKNDTICAYSIDDLIEANKGKRGFTYTHYPLIPEQFNNEVNEVKSICEYNLQCVKRANENGFTINASADNLEMAEKLFNKGLPTCAVVNEDMQPKGKTKNGISYIACPAQVFENKTCANCGLCQKANRKMIIVFYVHGARKRNYKG